MVEKRLDSFWIRDYLPTFCQAMDKFDRITCLQRFLAENGAKEDDYSEFIDNVLLKFRPLFVDELAELIPEWSKLEAHSCGFISVHSYLVTYLTWTDPRVK